MSLPHDIDTTSPPAVAAVAVSTFDRIGFRRSAPLIKRLFRDISRMFAGQYPGYRAIDMRYHNLEHTLQATVCVCQILEGRQAAQVEPVFGRRDCELLLAAVLLHDTGYLKRSRDIHGTGAKYTLVHEHRSCDFARAYLPSLGFTEEEIDDVTSAIRCTGPRNKISAVHFSRPEARVLATIVVTSDYLSQMATIDYVDKLPALFYEFEEAYIYEGIPESERPFRSPADLIHKTEPFWEKFVRPMLESDLGGVYRYIAPTAEGTNPFIEAVERNVARVRALATAPDISLDPFPTPARSATQVR